jgi:hypothetical protein
MHGLPKQICGSMLMRSSKGFTAILLRSKYTGSPNVDIGASLHCLALESLTARGMQIVLPCLFSASGAASIAMPLELAIAPRAGKPPVMRDG